MVGQSMKIALCCVGTFQILEQREFLCSPISFAKGLALTDAAQCTLASFYVTWVLGQ